MELKEINYEFNKCGACAYKDRIPGNAHIQCTFDWIGALQDMTVPYYPIGVSYGIRSGWYDFPFQFDPTWLALPCPAFHDKSLTGDDTPTLRHSQEMERILVSMQFNKRGMEDKITEDDFNKMIRKYNKVMENLDNADSE